MSLTERTWTECAYKGGCADDIEDARTCGHGSSGTGYANDHISSNEETMLLTAAAKRRCQGQTLSTNRQTSTANLQTVHDWLPRR